MMKNILIVDDDYGVGSALSKFLQKKQFCTEEASSGSIAINKALTNEYDVVILDQVMSEMTGTDVLIELKKIIPQSKIKILKKLDFDFIQSTLSNPIRRSILKLIKSHNGIHFMKITKELCVDVHTKVVYHLKNLISAGLLKKDEEKGYQDKFIRFNFH
jgi:CheY-like chemotaxis protein